MKLYIKYFSMNLKSQMQYKTSFFLTAAGQFLTTFTAFLSVYFMFDRFNKVDGFEFSEVLLCFATVLMAFSISESFARGFDTFPTIIGNGEFDRIMVRPRNEIFQVLATKIDLTRLGRLIQSILIFAYAIPHCGVSWTFDKVITLVLMIISGVVIFSGLFVIYAALCFFTTEALEFMNIFTDGGREFGQYPFSVYGEKVLKFFTFVIPLALFQYYPFLYLTGRSESVICMLTPLAGMLFIIPCLIIWKIGLSHYKSTGS